ncbi:MAG: hypothetical protein J6S85_19375 [Methanobrevibacter sp.]|nr:hypothetical protein [Methanobrevibacter sp.]
MDKLLEELFKPARWEKAIDIAVEKNMKYTELENFCNPKTLQFLYTLIGNNQYDIIPPHQQKIPKDDGGFRTVYINEDIDRILLSIINEMLFEFCGSLVSERSKAYQTNLSCGKVVREVVSRIADCKLDTIGIKADLSKYFDSVPLRFIEEVFDKVEAIVGKSAVVNLLRRYYENNKCLNEKGEVIEIFQSLKQGCAVASFLANAVLYDMDEEIKLLDVYYVRYSDDILIIGNEWEKGREILEQRLNEKELILNPKKVEVLSKQRFFKFLGFMIRGTEISLSKKRLKNFQKEIFSRCKKANSLKSAIHSVNRYLYNGQFCWAKGVLAYMNNQTDIQTLNTYVMDCLRAVQTKRFELGGLGIELTKKDGVVTRGTGANVTTNRQRTPKEIDGYLSLWAAKKALSNREMFDSLVRCL